jgi:membrane associated rhomboid family serine protease
MFPLQDINEARTVPFVTYFLILINCLVFFVELSHGEGQELENFVRQYGLIPARFFGDIGAHQASTIVSSMFLHSGWGHIVGNMWFLWIFGDNIEDQFGHFGYLIYYLFTGTCAALTHLTSLRICLIHRGRKPKLISSGIGKTHKEKASNLLI